MAESTIPILRGFDYQARLFWLKICDLFLPNTKTKSVGYEFDEMKSFDDVVVTYTEPIYTTNGLKITKDFYQSKFHAYETNPIYYMSLTDPAFIGAKTNSFLQKLNNAYKTASAENQTYIYNLFTPSTVHPADALSEIYSKYDGTLNVKRLLTEGKTAKSKMGEIRDAWANHLGISEEDLGNLLLTLKIINGPSSSSLLEKLDRDLMHAGFKTMEKGSISNAYDDLVRKLQGMGENLFDRDKIQKIAENEKLWLGTSAVKYPSEKTIGIRSFIKFAEEMPNLTSDMICLSANFNGRFINSEELWDKEILPKVAEFMQKHESAGETVFVLLETHISVAFAVGYSIHPKASTKIVPVQKNEFRHPEAWNVTEVVERNGWSVEEISQKDSGDELALSVSVTHPVVPDVKDYVARSLSSVGKILSFEVKPSPSRNSVKDGNHAFSLAEELAQKVINEVKTKNYQAVHLFTAAPVGFMFYLGKMLRLPSDCPIVFYEYDFDARSLGAYTKSVTFD